VQQPEWARPAAAGALLPVMLAGAWNDTVEADRLALSTLAQAPYDEVARLLVRWSNESDPPVRRLGSVWMVVSSEDAWALLGRYLTRDHLESLEIVVLEVLGAPDPQFDLPEERRWMAGALGTTLRHSKVLREGIAQTLGVMGSRGGSTMVAAGVSAADYAGRIVRRLLEHANADWRVWASLSPVLPRLAEAGPDALLGAVDAGLGGAAPILQLFGHDGDPLFSSSPHTGLLWAFETVAWSPAHLSQAAVLLARLARLDPGGRLQNRPQNSLRSIFLLWHPQTVAGLEPRLRVLVLLLDREPEVAWRLLRHLLPEHHGIGHNNPRPRLREWAPDSPEPVTRGEFFKGVSEVVTRMLACVGVNGPHWQDLIEAFPNLAPTQREAVMERLASIDADGLEAQDRAVIWDALRRLIARHRSSPDAEWALPPKYLDGLEVLYGKFLPADPTARYGWLFSDHPELPEGRARDWKTQQDALDKARLEAVQAISAMGGLADLMELARHVARPDELGVTIGRSELLVTEEDELLAAHLAGADAAHARLAHGFAAARAWSRGSEWAQGKLQAGGWSTAQRAEFLTYLPFERQTWALAEASGADTETAYWRLVRPFIAGEDLETAVSKLLEHGRPYTAIRLLSTAGTGGVAAPTPALILGTLERAVRTSPEVDPPSGHLAYDLGELLDLLEQGEEVDEARVAAVEWAFLPVLDRHERKPKVLHRALARNPRFFAELVALAFRGEGEEPRQLSEQEQARAHHAHDLLDSWRVVPGSNGEHVDAAALGDWVRQAREAMAATGRGPIGDEQIGQLLSGAPADEGDTWPHPAVCDVIESAASADLAWGIEVGVYNSRGTVTKHPFEGGRQERQLAERYAGFATTLSDRWPRTAALLRRLADGYRAEAQREDERAELREDRD
jgi:transposase